MTLEGFATRAEEARASFTFPERATAVAVAYLIGRIAAFILATDAAGSASAFDPAGELTASAVVGASLTWLAPRLTGSSRRRTATLAGLLLTSVAAVMLEGSVFAPTLSPGGQLVIGLVLQLAVSVVTAWIAVALHSSRAIADSASDSGLPSLAARFAGAALVYVGTYFVSGSINYLLVTGPYYKTHAGGLTTPEPGIVLVVALAEGALLTLGAIPLARTLTGSALARALATGGALWVIGGLVPLLQAASLPDVIRVASAVEILFQKVPLGIAVAWLFGTTSIAAAASAGPSCTTEGPR